jgi:hypothetical protein
MFHHQTAGQNHNVNAANKSFHDRCGKIQTFGNVGNKSKLHLRKLKADSIWGMLATSQFRIFCLPA